MTKYKVTIIVECEDDPSALLDNFDHMVSSGEVPYTKLDSDAEESGEAVTVEEL